MKLEGEEQILMDAILAARTVEDFLWGDLNASWGTEEWKRMMRKRYTKLSVVMTRLDAIDPLTNPHWKREAMKRLLQTAALSIAMLKLMMDDAIEPGVISSVGAPSNLPQYAEPIGRTYENSLIKKLQELNAVCNSRPSCEGCVHNNEVPCSIRVEIKDIESIVGD